MQQNKDANYTSLPSDLQQKKDANIKMVNQLENRKEKSSSSAEYEGLVVDYKKLRNEIIAYTQECNNRGIVKNNDAMIQNIDRLINELEHNIMTGSAESEKLRKLYFPKWHPKNDYLKNYDPKSNSRNTETTSSKKHCSDEESYDKGYSLASNQRSLIADCDYLFDVAQASGRPLSHYCFCRGVEAYQKQNK